MDMTIRPMTAPERMYCYTQDQKIMEQTGCIGHLRGDMGSSGKQFFSSWDDHQAHLKTQSFKDEFDAVINALRSEKAHDGILASRGALANFCWAHPDSKITPDGDDFGFRLDTENYSYMIRLNPNRGMYNIYCYCYQRELLDNHLHSAEIDIAPNHDHRTKPDTQWTYYVVDHLPTGANFYRFDTVEEAIEKYTSLPDNLISAIGSSLGDKHQIDHIQKISGRSVLIRDMDNMDTPLWRDSEEIAAAVAQMREKLHVEYELDSQTFGQRCHSVAVPVTDGKHQLSSHLTDKRLDPKVYERPLSGINEVFVEGQGWTDILTFLKEREDVQWSRENGYSIPFVSTLNIRYVNTRGHFGQVDISPADYKILRDDYNRSLQRTSTLDERIAAAGARAGKDPEPEQGRPVPAKQR